MLQNILIRLNILNLLFTSFEISYDINYIRPNQKDDTYFIDFFEDSKQTFETNFKDQPAFD